MLRVRNALHAPIILLVVLLVALTGCDVEPPDSVTTPVPFLVGEYDDLPELEGSSIVDEVFEKGYVSFGFPAAVPYTFIRKPRRDFIGIVPDLGDLIGNQIGLPVEVRLQRWHEMPEQLEGGEVQLIIGGPVSRPEFDGMEFVQIGERGHCLVARADDDRFQEVEDILKPGVVVAAVQGTDGEQYLITEHPEVEVRSKTLAEPLDTVLDVLAGEADVTLVYSSVTPLLLEKHSELKAFPSDCVEHPIWSAPWGVSLPPGDPVFLQFLQALVGRMEESGWLEEHSEQWLDSDLLQDAMILEE
jgi:ABC-type amino acid transport substrate-binding protein